MDRKEEQGPKYIVYTFKEDEFKRKLGIESSSSVLTVSIRNQTDEVVVRLVEG